MPQVNPFLKPEKSTKSPSAPSRDAASPDPSIPVVKPPVTGFWRRLGALLFDFIFFYFIFRVLGYIAGDALIGLGPWANPIATAILLAYFILGNGPVGKGRTLGKFITALRVTDLDGNTLSLGRSFLRTLILFPGIFISAFVVPVVIDRSKWSEMLVSVSITGVLMVALFIGTALAIVFNPFKQGIHDHLAKSLVRPAAAPRLNWEEICSIVGPNWRRYYKQSIINGLATFALVFALAIFGWVRPNLNQEGGRQIYESAMQLSAELLPPHVSVYSNRLVPPGVDMNDLQNVPPDVIEAFDAQLTDATSSATVGVPVTLSRAGRWDESGEQLDTRVRHFIDEYHSVVTSRRLAQVEQIAAKALAEHKEKAASMRLLRNMEHRPIVYLVSVEEALTLFFPIPVKTNKVQQYEFSLPPVKEGPNLAIQSESGHEATGTTSGGSPGESLPAGS